MSRLEACHLRKSYGTTPAVDDVSFAVAAGEVLGLLGPNGAGKTTTMMMLTGLLKPDGGEVLLDDHALNPRDMGARRSFGFVPQDLAVYPDLTARENLMFFAGMYGLPGAKARSHVDEALKLVGLSEQARQRTHTFSGGMKRRLNLAAGLVHKPSILVLDEPTVGVDPQTRAHLLDRVRQLADGGVVVVYASHYMEEVQAVCDRVAIVDHGRVVTMGSLRELLQGVSRETRVTVAGWRSEWAGRLGDHVRVIGHEEDRACLVIDNGGDAGPGRTPAMITSTLRRIEELGGELVSIQTRERDLESLFLDLTGRRLRD